MSSAATPADNDSILYQGLFRVYRNAIVSFIRQRLKATYPDNWEDQLRKPLAKEWATLVASANHLFSSGSVTVEPGDFADYLSLNHFFPIFEAHMKILWPAESQDPVWRQNVLMWCRQAKHVRDAVAHPTTQELTFSDAYVPLDAARRLLTYVDAEAANSIVALQRQLQSDTVPEPRDALVADLPPREDVVVDFVGRQQILAELERWFADPQSRRWVLCGDGGKGKSAIAYEFATRVAASGSPNFTLVVWLSAKQKRFVEGMAVPAAPDFVDLAGAQHRLLRAYGAPVPTDGTNPHALLMKLMNELPALIIVDDIDSLSSTAEAANEFFALQAPTTRSKVLLTSRRVPFGLGSAATVVSGLEGEEATAFIQSRLRIFGIDPNRVTSPTADRILSVTDGSPLYIEDLLRLVKSVAPAAAVRAWEQRSGLQARKYALEREVELLTPDARRILLALALVDGPASIKELAVTAGISEDAAGDGLGELGRLFLVPQPRLFEDQERYTLNRNTRSLVVDVFGKTQDARQIRAAINYVWGQGAPVGNDRDVGSFCRQAVLLVRDARHADAEDLLTSALAGDYPNEPRLLGQLAWVYKRWIPPRVADARQYFRRTSELRNSSPDTFWHWATMERDVGEWQEALRIAELGLQRYGADHGGLLLVAALASERQAAELSAAFLEDRGLGSLKTAKVWLQRAVACSDLRLRPQELSKAYGSLVRVLRKLGQVEELDSVLEAWSTRLPEDPYLRNERLSRDRLGR